MNPDSRPARIPDGTDPAAKEAAELLRRCADRDEEAFSRLYDLYGGLLYSVACKMLGPSQEAEDAVQDAFLQAWGSAANFDPAKGSARSWLVLLTRSRCLDRLRRRGTRARNEAAAAAEEPLAREDAALSAPEWEQARLGAAVRAAVDELPAEQRRAVEAAFFGGLSHSRIAAETGEPLGTVKTRLRLGARKLSDKLRPLWNP